MPLSLQYISFVISVISLVLTLLTFVNTCRVNKRIVQIREREQFYNNRKEISDKLDGYVRSIINDHLHENDKNNTLTQNILITLTDLDTKYTILSKQTRKCIYNAKKHATSYSINWNLMASILTTLKNYIDKEI
ncbi:MAG: hypothetical protein K2N87_03985 [Eubacterium sp.]|nr:hypothetical protein [Eubacterium sp.]